MRQPSAPTLSCVVVSPYPPIPGTAGCCIRVAATVESLASQHTVTVICTHEPTPFELERSREFCTRIGVELRMITTVSSDARRRSLTRYLYAAAATLGRVSERWSLTRLPAEFESLFLDADLVWLYRHAPLRRHALPADLAAPLVFDVDDLEERVVVRHGSFPRLQEWLRRRRIVHTRDRLLAAADVATVCSDVDSRRLEAPCPVRVLPNTYPSRDDARVRVPSGEGTPIVTMVARMDYEPNREGARWLIDEVWPLVTEVRADARLVLVGRLTETLVPPGAPHGITAVGEVDDVAPFVDSASVIVAPLHAGSGTRVKILEAFAARRPVVSTSLGAEGIDAVDGRSILIADDAADFARAILRLLDDPAVAAVIAEGGQALFADRYSFEHFRATVLEIAAAVR